MSQLSHNLAVEKKPKLLDQVRFAIRAKHYSIRTEQSYVSWIKRFILFHHKRHPLEMGEAEINQFLTHLAVKENVAASTQNQALCAIVFLYKQVLNRELGELGDVVWGEEAQAVARCFHPRRGQSCIRAAIWQQLDYGNAALWVGLATDGVLAAAGEGP